MASQSTSSGIDSASVRERLPQKPDVPQKTKDANAAHEVVKALNEREQNADKEEREKKTFGRTPDGTGEFPGELVARQCQWRAWIL